MHGVLLLPLQPLVTLVAGRNVLDERPPLEGLRVQAGSSLLRMPITDLQSPSIEPSVASTLHEKSLVKLCLYYAQEGSGEGGLMLRLSVQVQSDAFCLFNNPEHLECFWIICLVSKENHKDYCPDFHMRSCFVPARDGIDLLPPHQ